MSMIWLRLAYYSIKNKRVNQRNSFIWRNDLYQNQNDYLVKWVENNKEMSNLLAVPYDVLSDEKLELRSALDLPIFSINKKNYLKRITLIIEKNIIKKVFYPIYPIDKHIEEVLKWLKQN